MTTEAERVAEVFESFAKDHKPDGWPAVQQHFLSEAASVLRLQAAEIERLKSEAELFAKHTGLTLAAKDALLRQALVLLRGPAPNGYGVGSEQEAVIAAIKQHLGEV